MKKMIKHLLSLVLILSSLLPTASALAQDNILRVQVEVEVASIDPQIATDGTSLEVMASFMDGLVEFDADGVIQPLVAESWETNEEETVYTFKLREDANWSNGTPVTAHDFVFAWQRLVDPATGSEYAFIADTANIVNAGDITAGDKDPSELGVKAVDDKTLEVTLTQPTPYFMGLIGFVSFWPINEEFYNSTNGQFATSADTVLSNGAFILDNYQAAASTVSLVKNPDYYQADRVSLDGIEYQVIKDSQQAVLGFQTGQIDVTAITGEQVALYENDPAYTTAGQGYMWFISPNNENEDLANSNLRLALGKAFDRDVIAHNVLKDGSVGADFFVPHGLAASPDGVDFREDAGGGLMASNVEEAQAHFEDAKQELGKDSFEFGLLVEDTEASLNVAQSIQAQIESNLPGVTIQIEQTPKKNRLERMQAGEFDLGLTRWGPDYADPTTYLQLLSTGSSYNHARYSNEQFDQDFEAVMTGDLVTDEAARWEKMKEMEANALADGAVLPVYQAYSAMLIRPGIEGVTNHVVGTPRIFKYASKAQ